MTLIEKAALWANAGVGTAPHSFFHGAPGGYGMGSLAAHSPAYKPPIVSPTPGVQATTAGVQQVAAQQAAQHGVVPPKMAGESSAVSQEPVKQVPIKPFRLQGQEAWDALKKSDAWLSLTPFAQGFFSKCLEDGLLPEQITAGISKVAAIDPEISKELRQSFEKLSGFGAAMGRLFSRAPRIPTNAAGLYGTGAPSMATRALTSPVTQMLGRGAVGAAGGVGLTDLGQQGVSAATGQPIGPNRAGLNIAGGVVGGLSGAMGARPGAAGGIARAFNKFPMHPAALGAAAIGAPVAAAGMTYNHMNNHFQGLVNDKMQGVARATGTSPELWGKFMDNPGEALAGASPEDHAALQAFAQKHLPGMDPMSQINGMLNKIPWLGEQNFWQTMHPGGKLMALAGLLGGGAGLIGGNGMMAGAGGLAALAPFLYHHFQNNGGAPMAPPPALAAPPAPPPVQAGGWGQPGGQIGPALPPGGVPNPGIPMNQPAGF